MTFRTPLCDLLGVEKPIMLAGMGGVSYAEVCAAVSNAGGFGCLGMAGLSVGEIRRQMKQVKSLTDKPFGVDLLAAVPGSLEAAIDVIIEEGAKAFVAGLGAPISVIKKLHDAGILVFTVCGSVKHALKAQDAGCDGVVAQGTEAGGHTGRIAGMALIPQVVDAVRVPVVAAGAIVDGRGLAAALAFGAQGVWMGTRFIASVEAHAGPVYKQAILNARDEDTTITRCYTGKTLRTLDNAYVRDWEQRAGDIQPFPQQAIHSVQSDVMGGIGGKLEPLNPDRDCLAMGQGAGAIREVLTCAEIIESVMAEAEVRMRALGGLAGGGLAGAA